MAVLDAGAEEVNDLGESFEVVSDAVDLHAVRQGNVVATSFHPELTGDRRVHALFVDIVRRHLAETAGAAGDERGSS